MGTGWVGLGQPAADDRRLAVPGEGLVRQEARESGRRPERSRFLPSRRLNLSGTAATTREDATSAYALRPVAGVALAAHRLGVSGTRVVFTWPEKELRVIADQRRLGQPRPSGL
jgi:hypothetical protein